MRPAICVGAALLAVGSAVFLGACDDDDFDNFFDETDVVGRMVLPDSTPAAGASCEIFLDNISFGFEIADPQGFFEFDDWPEHWEPILVRGVWVQPGTGTIFRGASPLVGTSNSGDTDLGNIVLHPTTDLQFQGAVVPAGLGFADPDQDGRLEVILLDPASGKASAIVPDRQR